MPRRLLALAALASVFAATPALADDCTEGRRQADQLVTTAGQTNDREAAWALYAQAGEAYLALWQKHGEAPIRAHAAPTCPELDAVLYNASKAFQAARDIPRAITVGRLLVDPGHGLIASPLARKMVYEIGARHHAIAEYADAALWYERYARESPKEEKAPEALADALVLRLALGDERAAVADAELYDRTYGAAQRARSAQIAFALAAHDLERERWAAAEKRFAAAEARIDRDAALAVRFQMHALRGRALRKLGKAREATAQHRLVIELSRDPQTMRRLVTGVDDRTLGKALMAVGESLFHVADEAAQSARAERLPAYQGKRDRDAVERWAHATLAPALAKRRAAIGAAERAYGEVMRIEPIPPPRWMVAASAATARLWADLADEIAALASVGGKKPDPTLTAALAPARAATQERAIAAARACVAMGAKLETQADDSPFCAAYLARELPAAHPRLDEIMPQPRWISAGFGAAEPLAEKP